MLKLGRQGGALLIGFVCALIAGTHSAAAQTSTLPAGWTHRDIGSPAVAGSAEGAAGTITVRGAGTDIGGTSDQFHYAYQPTSGDVDIRVRVADLLDMSPGAKAGVMVRESMNATAKNAMMFLSTDQKVAFQWRSRDGRKSSQVSGATLPAPAWIRLVRQSNTFRAYSSPTGASWTLVGSATVKMSRNVYVGLAVTSHYPSQTATGLFSNLSLGSSTASLPTPWVTTDIGNPALAGTASASSGTFTVAGSGTDIWNTSDQFRFVYQAVTGDTQIVARVASLQAANTWSKAGVMIREAITGPAAHSSVFATASGAWVSQCRLLVGALSYQTAGSAGAAPGWVRLVREGDLFSTFQSVDGSDWVLVDSETIAMPATVYVGLAVTSRDSTALSTATFSNVVISAPTSSNDPPTVSISDPSAGASYTAPANISISATAGDVDGSVSVVNFYAGTQLVGSDTSAPFSVTWSNVASGTYSLTAVATDNEGETTTSMPVSVTVGASNNPPTVTISAGGTYTAPANIAISATASDVDGSVTRVDFYAGTQLVGSDLASPFSVTWSNVAAGTHSLTAVATDNEGKTTTSLPVSVTVAASNTPPTVVIFSGLSYTAPANISISATASDVDGTVTRVNFYAGTQLVGSDTASPFSVTWSNVAAGTYTLTAVATDDDGATATSGAVTVTVAPPPVVVPTTVAFVPGADYVTNVTSWTVELRRATDPATALPVATRNVGKPAPVGGEISVDISTLVNPLAAGSYYAVVVTTGPGGSTSSSPSAAFSK